MILLLKNPINRQQTIQQVEIVSIADFNGDKRVVAQVVVEVIGPQTLTLWEGDAYDAIGQWTDSQAQARVLELLDAQLSGLSKP